MIATRWVILFVIFLSRIAMALQFQTIAGLRPVLMEFFSLDFVWIGTLIGLYMLPGVVVALPSGLLGQRFGAKSMALAGMLLMAAGGALSATESFFLLFVGRLIGGIGAVIFNVIMTKMVTDWFAGREIVSAMAISLASWPLGLSLGLVLFPRIAEATSWQAVMLLSALAALGCFVLMAVIYRDPDDDQTHSRQAFKISLSVQEWKLISLAGTLWGTFNVGYIVLVSFLPDLFMRHGYSLIEANGLVSALGWILIPSVPLAGYLAERFRRPNSIMVSGLTIAAVAALILPFAGTPAVVFWFLAVAIGLPAGVIVSLAAEALSPENRSTGLGIFYTLYYGGMAALPPIAGWARDLSGSPAATPLFASCMMLIALLSLAGFRIIQGKAKA